MVQGLLQQQQPYGEALVRLATERQKAEAALAPAVGRAAELEQEISQLTAEANRLRARNATLLERERKRRQGQ